MSFAIEVLLGVSGTDAFGSRYRVDARRLRYEVELTLKTDANGNGKGVFVSRESCLPIAKKLDKATFLRSLPISYSGRKRAFIGMREADDGIGSASELRQDCPAVESAASKRGRPVTLPATEASRTALSTIASAEFPQLIPADGNVDTFPSGHAARAAARIRACQRSEDLTAGIMEPV